MRSLSPRICPILIECRASLAALLLFFVGVLASHAVTLNSQEQAIADLLVNSSGQNRPFLRLDPVLTEVARARAADMARRGYFSHVNPDGEGPNYLVDEAGYPLPPSYTVDRSANNIESIAAGRTSASATWGDWMNSSAHKTHLLAEASFYETQTSYGVGYVSDPGSDYGSYWVVITAPPRPVPSLTIKTPAPSSRVTSSQVAVTGTTGGEKLPQLVQVRVENAAGVSVYKPATGIKDWTTTVNNLAPGLNTIRIRSLDAQGIVLAQATRAVRYVVMEPLTVSITGDGTVSGSFLGVTERELGTRYTVVAKPAPGSFFVGWSGGLISSKPELMFTMTQGLTLTATFIPNPFLARRGAYNGVVMSSSDPTPGSFGVVNIALTSNGTFTGRLTIGKTVYRLAGRLAPDGTATVSIPRPRKEPLIVTLSLDVSGSNGLAVNVTDGGATATAQAAVAYHRTAAPYAHAGRYTISLPTNPADIDRADIPQGNGYATLLVSAGGRVTMAAKLADGRAFSHAVRASQNGAFSIYAPLYDGIGSVAGNLRFSESDVSDLEGTLIWNKPNRPSDSFYPRGFSTTLPVVGSRYRAPALGAPVVVVSPGENNATLSLGDGNLGEPIAQAITLEASNRVRLSTPVVKSLSVQITPANGTFQGTFTHPVSGRTHTIRGVIFQKQNAGYGFFLGVDQSGYSNITLAP